MFLKTMAKIGSAFAVAAFLSTSAMAIPVTPDGILASGESDDYDSGNFVKNTTKNVSLTFIAAPGATSAEVGVGGAVINPGNPAATFSVFTLLFKDLTLATTLSTNLLPSGAGTFVYNLIAGHSYEVLLNVTSGNSAGSPRFTYSVVISAVPVPPALLLLGTGLLGAGALGRRRSKAKKISV